MNVVERFWADLLGQLPCVIRSRVPGTCEGRAHQHHIAEGSGLRSDFAKVNLCWGHHEGPAGLHPTVGGRGSKEFIRQYRPPGDSEYGLLVWQMEDVASFLRRTRPGLQDPSVRSELGQWQPIKTAPHKNEPLIVLTDEGNVCDADNYAGLWNMPIKHQDEQPIFWMLRPATPSKRSDGGKGG